MTDASFDSRKAPVARGFFLGDYEGLGSSGAAVFPFFAMPHGSDPASIFVRKLSPPPRRTGCDRWEVSWQDAEASQLCLDTNWHSAGNGPRPN